MIRLTAYTAADQGMKAYQQDRAVSINASSLLGMAPSMNDTRYSYFAVYDGHGGDHCSTHLQDKFHGHLFKELTKGLGVLRSSKPEVVKAVSKRSKRSPRQFVIHKALNDTCKAVDKALLRECLAKQLADGSCAISVLVEGNVAWVMNVGDSRAVLARRKPVGKEGKKEGPLPVRTVRLSTDHTPVLVKEKQRIEKSGGFVDAEGRVCGRLAVSRSFGDTNVKKKGVVSQPDIAKFTLSSKDKFMLIACDGLWSVFSPEDAVAFVDKAINTAWQWELENPPKPLALKSLQRKERPLEAVARKACLQLIREAVRVRKVKDNTTVILVLFGEPR